MTRLEAVYVPSAIQGNVPADGVPWYSTQLSVRSSWISRVLAKEHSAEESAPPTVIVQVDTVEAVGTVLAATGRIV